MTGSYQASKLPLQNGVIDLSVFFEELIDATSKLEVYKEKLRDSKLDSSWLAVSQILCKHRIMA